MGYVMMTDDGIVFQLLEMSFNALGDIESSIPVSPLHLAVSLSLESDAAFRVQHRNTISGIIICSQHFAAAGVFISYKMSCLC